MNLIQTFVSWFTIEYKAHDICWALYAIELTVVANINTCIWIQRLFEINCGLNAIFFPD